MLKEYVPKTIKLSGMVILISSIISLIYYGFIYALAGLLVSKLISYNNYIMRTFSETIIDLMMGLTRNPLIMFYVLLALIIGIIFIIASNKIKNTKKEITWTLVVLFLSIFIIFEMRTNVILFYTSGIIAFISSTYKLYLLHKQKKQ